MVRAAIARDWVVMKVGMLARGEDRGLGIQTWEFHRHMRPDRTLLVDMGELGRGFPVYPERFEHGDVTAMPFRGGQLPEQQVREWLDGLDVVFTAETFYDWRMVRWARDAGVATVCQVNPEFWLHAADPQLPHPTQWWPPSPWLADRFPADRTRLMPVPVADDRFAMIAPDRAGPLRVLHVAGHRAAADRNGTLQLLQALRTMRQPARVRLLTQGARLPRVRQGRNPHLHVEVEVGGRPHYWDLYSDADVLVMPRRYGGLCLPVQEAMAAGLGIVMTDCPPNDWWPARLVAARHNGDLNTASGPVRMWAAEPRQLGAALDALAADPDAVADLQAAAVAWAHRHSWSALAGTYLAALQAAADLPA